MKRSVMTSHEVINRKQAIEERMTELFNSRKAQVWDKSIFASILQDDGKHPSTETTLPRLIDEAKFLLVAGTDAPSQVMAITLFHVLRNPRAHARLKDELTQALPRAAMTPSWQEMEKLPYLVSGRINPICLPIH